MVMIGAYQVIQPVRTLGAYARVLLGLANGLAWSLLLDFSTIVCFFSYTIYHGEENGR